MATTPAGQEGTLASLAVCAGFDYVSFTDAAYIEAFVKAQTGYQTVTTSYIEGANTGFLSVMRFIKID